MTLDTEEPIAIAVVEAIHTGDIDGLQRLLADNPDLAQERLGDDDPDGMSRSLLHVATDWPGNFPNVAATIATLVEAGADVNARFAGPHTETPLHWAASSDDVDALDALVAAGADLEATGAVIAGGTPLTDAVAFGQWHVARRLVAHGAEPTFREAAALGQPERVERACATDPPPTRDELTQALWYACHGGQQPMAVLLLEQGADLNWVSTWDQLTPLDAAERSEAHDLVRWLKDRGAASAKGG